TPGLKSRRSVQSVQRVEELQCDRSLRRRHPRVLRIRRLAAKHHAHPPEQRLARLWRQRVEYRRVHHVADRVLEQPGPTVELPQGAPPLVKRTTRRENLRKSGP